MMNTEAQGQKAKQGINWNIEKSAEALISLIVTIASVTGIWSLNLMPFAAI
jgi:hypothetical protein